MYLLMHKKSLGLVASTLISGAALALGAAAGAPLAGAAASGSSSGSSFSDALKLSSTIGKALATGGTVRSEGTVSVSGQGERSYILYVPEDYDVESSYPVVFAYSGWTHPAAQGDGYMHIQSASGSNAIVVYPEPRANAEGVVGWEGPTYAPTQRGEDVAFTKAILEQLAGQYNVDRNRVYATGLSNGGGMALADACQAPDVFAAVAGVASATYTPVLESCSGMVPTLLIHGTEDGTINYANDGTGLGGPYYSTRTAFARIGNQNGCNTSGDNLVTREGDGYTSFHYRGCTDTVLYRVNGGTHTWFPSSPTATREVWNFLQTHTK